MFYAENIKGESFHDDVPRIRVPYFYIHGRLQDESGYDCCDATLEEMRYITMKGVYLSKVKTLQGTEERVLVCTYLSLGRINGLIVAVDDIDDNIKYCIDRLQTNSIYFHHQEEINKKYPNIQKLIELCSQSKI